jgi:S-DNA-T family DNA segregation ATPase FtsK/SpoIIIE
MPQPAPDSPFESLDGPFTEPVGVPGMEQEPVATVPRAPRPRRPAGKAASRWTLPPGTLLASDAPLVKIDAVQAFVNEQAKLIDQKLLEFGITGKVVSVTSGPSVILFEWLPAAGVKVSRLETMRDDLKLALKAERIRMVVPIPGKGTVGIEIPHPSPAGVTLGALLAGHPSPAKAGDLPMFLGRVLTGETLVADLAQMPHLLIAGTTGSGKSVCIHTLLVSLLMTRSPDELRLLLVDPKRVEMIAYRELPHLLAEVITDPRIAVLKLRWMVSIMEARYKLLAHHACRDLHAFNRRVKEEGLEPDPSLEQGAVTSRAGLPWIVVAIDELADLMVAKARDVEDALQRLAQMARGVGIHLVVATQRPSVDVLTGVIKANLPSRLSFRVATGIDSRTILDATGAEQLLGKGDLLFSPTGAPEPTRAQGAYLAPAEIARVIEHWTTQGPPEYAFEDSSAAMQEAGGGNGDGEDDPLYEEAVGVVVRGGEASVSMLQRKLSIGFARAGRLIDLMERRGVVGPKQGSKAREILSGAAGAGEERT